MNNKKKIVEESFNKMKTLLESKINEAQVAPAAPAAPAQAQKPAVDPQRDQKIGQNIDATMDQAMAKLVQGLPSVLAKFAKSGGDKDGALDAPGVYDNNAQAQPAQTGAQPIQEGMISEITFNESMFMGAIGEGLNEEDLNEGGILGLAMAVPAILKYGGKAAEWTGKKMNSQWLQKWGGKTAKAGEKIHHKYIAIIEKAIAPFMPNADKAQIHKAANGIFMGGVAIMFAGGLAHPGILTGAKGAELGEFSLANIGNILPKLGFA